MKKDNTSPLVLDILGQTLLLYSSRVVFWQEEKTLLLADTHFGKATHFRKQGIAVPNAVADQSLQQFEDILLQFQPERTLVLGDFFHSDPNSDLLKLEELLTKFPKIELVAGNHDMHALQDLQNLLTIHKAPLQKKPFIFSHLPLEEVPDSYLNMHGHWHPGIQLVGKGRQRISLPCFYWYDQNKFCLPAFEAFAGKHYVKPQSGDQVFVIVNQEVRKV